MWGHKAWHNTFFSKGVVAADYLSQYADYYTSVEGNTTFYAQPNKQTVEKWRDQTPSHFRFCFKFPQTITHQNGLKYSHDACLSFIELLSPLHDKLGQLMLQLPPYFDGNSLSNLANILAILPNHLTYAVEVRHTDYFAKGEIERDFNRLLMAHNVNRVLMDTRPVHSEAPTSDAIIDAQQKKPKVPVHVIATGQQPIVRFVGQTNLSANMPFIQNWLPAFKKWLNEGKTPYLFIHSADNHNVHQLSQLFLKMLSEHIGQPVYPDWQWPIQKEQQRSLF